MHSLRFRSIALFLLTLALGCDSEKSTTHSGADGGGQDDGGADGSTNTGVSKSIGPEGGSLETDSGLSVEVPAGAVADAVEFQVNEVSAASLGNPLAEELTVNSPIFELTPHGQTFDEPVTVRLPHTNADDFAFTVLLHSEDGETWAPMESIATETELEFSVTAFSYFVAVSAHHDIQRAACEETTRWYKHNGAQSTDYGTPTMGCAGQVKRVPFVLLAAGGYLIDAIEITTPSNSGHVTGYIVYETIPTSGLAGTVACASGDTCDMKWFVRLERIQPPGQTYYPNLFADEQGHLTDQDSVHRFDEDLGVGMETAADENTSLQLLIHADNTSGYGTTAPAGRLYYSHLRFK